MHGWDTSVLAGAPAAKERSPTGETVGMGPTRRARVVPQPVLVAQTGVLQSKERARAPAASAPTRPAGWGAWLQIGFAARAFRISSAFSLAFAQKQKLDRALANTLSVTEIPLGRSLTTERGTKWRAKTKLA